MAKKLLQPNVVLKMWQSYQEDCKKNKKRPSSKVAKEFAKKAGMKSMGEVRCADDLTKQGRDWMYEKDKLEYQIEATYNPDFTIMDTKHPVYIEYKGKMTQSVRTKMAAVKKCHPEKRICLVFERSENKLSSKPNSMRYWRWAELNGYPWSEHFAKREWYTEIFWKRFAKENKK